VRALALLKTHQAASARLLHSQQRTGRQGAPLLVSHSFPPSGDGAEVAL
jgi:hypothetical protein